MVTTLGQRTTAPSWEQNSTWADARITSVSPLAFAPRSRKKSLQFYQLNLSRATSETVLHYTFVFEKKIHEIFVNQDEQRVLLIIVWTSIAVRLVKHDPWSSPASDVTMHDVVLHSSHLSCSNSATFLRKCRRPPSANSRAPTKKYSSWNFRSDTYTCAAESVDCKRALRAQVEVNVLSFNTWRVTFWCVHPTHQWRETYTHSWHSWRACELYFARGHSPPRARFGWSTTLCAIFFILHDFLFAQVPDSSHIF